MSLVVTFIIWVPLLAALVLPFMPDRTADQRGRIRVMGLGGTGVVLVFSLLIAYAYIRDIGTALGSLTENHLWIADFAFRSNYHVDIDGVTAPLLQLSALLFCCAALYSWKRQENIRLYVGSLLILETAITGILCAQDLILFVIFWGMQILPIYLLIRQTGGVRAVQTAQRYLAFALTSFFLLSVSTVLIIVHSPAAGQIHSSDMSAVLSQSLDITAAGVARDAFVLSLLACAIASAVAPFHRWYIGAATATDAGVASLVTGIVSKLGVYLALRVTLQAFPLLATQYSVVFDIVGCGVVVWGAVCALNTRDLREAVAYFAVAQTGLLVIGVGSGAVTAEIGLVLMLVGQGIAQALLTYVAGAVQERTRTSSLDKLSGLAWQAPRLAGFWMVAALSSIGVPLMAGFTAVFVLATGGIADHHIGSAALVVGTVATGYVLLRVGHEVFFGETREEFDKVKDTSTLDLTILIPLVVGIAIYGVVPGQIIPVIEATAKVIAARIGSGQ